MPNSPQSGGLRAVRRIKIHAKIQIKFFIAKFLPVKIGKKFLPARNCKKAAGFLAIMPEKRTPGERKSQACVTVGESGKSGGAGLQRVRTGAERTAVSATAALREHSGMV